MITIKETAISFAVQPTLVLRDSEQVPEHQHRHTLNEVQKRACRIHQRHGGIYGGYTLEDWLEAEHELDEQEHPQAPTKDRIH
jgi:hypothetical protein